ncbi:hypothetical protein CPS_4958 [Colwellia psychrerythraea 34H]|uniref:Uncharacterized protein n=1 Tax=Colwellia psychrerythraea (strain 34H / ATCC BAA-681) TaxID=167879 RepID=Q47UC6_COLP3|nr:hypothetical protein CPS_4958 [Colwellia psychrerythraea 34H]
MVRSLMITIAICNGCFAFIWSIYSRLDLAHIFYQGIIPNGLIYWLA